MLINIHTHHPDPSASTAIHSLYRDFGQAVQEEACSVGLHPWYLDPDTAAQELERVSALASLPQVYAIGECGLDKGIAADLAFQEAIFISQVELAQQVKKPLIVHCVRAFDELLRVLKHYPGHPPVIIHGFNRKWTIARPLLDAGCYLSFGTALLRSKTARETFRQVPDDRCFLETDDDPAPVRDVYAAAAALKNIPEAQVISTVANNFAAVFSK